MHSVIIVEDEINNRKALISYFPWSECNFSVVADFSDAKSALSYLEKNRVDVLLTDIMMPGMNGIDLIEKAKNIDPDIIPVVLSGYSDFDFARRAISLGVREYLLKPAGYEEIKEVFSRICKELEKTGDDKRLSSAELTSIMEKYIKENLESVSLKSLSERFSLNQFYISELFHRIVGISFQEYTLKARMEEAKRLLRETHLAVQDIAKSVGYFSASSFSRAFRDYCSLSPKEYREESNGR